MKLSRERKMLVGVLVIAGAGLLFDRVLLGAGMTGPAESSAGVIDASVDPATLLIPIDPAAAPALSSSPTLADRLRLATGGHAPPEDGGRDAFAVHPDWVAAAQQSLATDDEAVADMISAFRSAHKLDAVLVTGGRPCAVVDGRMVYIGQALGGYRLLEVEERSAVFERNGVRVVLHIEAAHQAGSASNTPTNFMRD